MSDSIAFVVSDVARLMRRRFDERARPLGVTRAQWKVLFTLSREEGMNQGALAERVDVEPISLCRMIDRLEQSGLVERRRDPADRRAWRIHLTPAAHPVIGDLRVRADALSEEALQDVSDEDRAHLSRILASIHGNLAMPAKEERVRHG